MSQSFLTKQGYTKLSQELDRLVNTERKAQAERIQEAIAAGGFEDNLVYETELEKQVLMEQRILELEELLKHSTLIDEKTSANPGFVALGAKVVVEVEGEKDHFTIVGSFEANPLNNLISNESPVGQALIGAKIGDIVEVSTPVVKLKYKVLEISYEK
jgi:transcription elongation factor GreA